MLTDAKLKSLANNNPINNNPDIKIRVYISFITIKFSVSSLILIPQFENIITYIISV